MAETLEKPVAGDTPKREGDTLSLTVPANPPSPAIETASEEKAGIRIEESSSKPNEIYDYLQNYNPVKSTPERKNQLGQYTIHPDNPLPEFNTGMSRAFHATDEKSPSRELYAMIGKDGISIRQRAMKELLGFKHPNMVNLVAAGKADLTNPPGITYVLIFTRPKGKSLTSVMRENPRGMDERSIFKEILSPVNEALLALREKGICHGHVHPDRIFIGNEVVLGECISEPCGYSQPWQYEAPERIMAMPIGKGEGDNKADVYALGMLALHLHKPRHMDPVKDEKLFTTILLTRGAYHGVMRDLEVSDTMTDLLRGTLTEKKNERWESTDIKKWRDGKRYNMIAPSIPREGSRPYIFNDNEYYNGRVLAHAFHQHWDAAANELKNNQLARWVELSMHKPDMAERVQRVIRTTSAEGTTPAKANNELVARTIIVLDNVGPIRLRALSAHLDGLGTVLADAFLNRRQDILNYMMELIESDLHSFWYDQHKQHHNTEISNVLYKLHKLRVILRMNSLGFGMERIVYDLNPSLPCQSPLVQRFHCLTLEELLTALDQISHDNFRGNAPMDRHIAGFISSRLELAKEIKLVELGNAQMAANPKLVGLKLLSMAQEKLPKLKSPGLANWAALETWSLLDTVHNRTLRKKLQNDLRKNAQSGNVSQVLSMFAESNVSAVDQRGFEKAQSRYQHNAKRIVELNDRDAQREQATLMGQKLSLVVSYIALAVIGYIIIKHQMML